MSSLFGSPGTSTGPGSSYQDFVQWAARNGTGNLAMDAGAANDIHNAQVANGVTTASSPDNLGSTGPINSNSPFQKWSRMLTPDQWLQYQSGGGGGDGGQPSSKKMATPQQQAAAPANDPVSQLARDPLMQLYLSQIIGR